MAERRTPRIIFSCLVCLILFFCLCEIVDARSAFSPRQSGMEPPGGPKKLDIMPGNAPGRTPEGGMGYVDAYGNTLDDVPPPEKKARIRPRAGAYGGYGKKEVVRPLPDPDAANRPPLWKFQ